LKTVSKHTSWVLSLAFNKKGDHLASGSSDYSVIIWNVKNWEIKQTLHIHSSAVWSLLFDASGNEIVIGHGDGTCAVSDWKRNQVIVKHKLHSG
jgi:WD40 repeat protein